MAQDTATPTIRRTVTRIMPGGDYFEANVELRGADDPRGLSPGFSITLDAWEKVGRQTGLSRKNQGRDISYGGADDATILRVFPQLAPLVALHLSAPDGTPFYASENGWYWYASYEGQGTHLTDAQRNGRTDREICASLLRVDPADLPDGLDRAGFEAFVDAQRDRWAREAAEGRAQIERLA